jgi:hypothetical protein
MLGIELDDAPPISDLEKDAKRDDLLSTRDRCEAIMNDAFGGTYWKAVVDAAAPSQRRAAVLSCYRELLHDARARFVLQIPIRTASNRHLYHLFHATRSAHGYVAMKEAVDYAFKHGPIAGSAAAVMRFLVHSDMNAIERRVMEVFAGKTVHWTGDKLDKAVPSLRRFVLEETPVFPSELPALKARLAAFRDPGFRRTLVYSFPVDVVG